MNAHASVHPVISSSVPLFEGKGIHQTRRVKSATGEALTKENGIKERMSQCLAWLMNEDNPRFKIEQMGVHQELVKSISD